MLNRAKYFQQLAGSVDSTFNQISRTMSELNAKEATSQVNLANSNLVPEINRRFEELKKDNTIPPDQMESTWKSNFDDLKEYALTGITNREAQELVTQNLNTLFANTTADIIKESLQRKANDIVINTEEAIENKFRMYDPANDPYTYIENHIKPILGYVDGKLENPIFSVEETRAKVAEYLLRAQDTDARLSIDALLLNDTSEMGISGKTNALGLIEENEFGFTPTEQKGLREYVETEHSKMSIAKNNNAVLYAEQASSTMTARLNEGITSAEAWDEINESIEDLPDYAKNRVLDEVKKAQIEYATDQGIEQWIVDKDSSLANLKEQRESIAFGTLNSKLYHNIPQSKLAMVNMYDTLIRQKEDELKKNTSINVSDKAADIVSRYDTGETNVKDAIDGLTDLLSSDQGSEGNNAYVRNSIANLRFTDTKNTVNSIVEQYNANKLTSGEAQIQLTGLLNGIAGMKDNIAIVDGAIADIAASESAIEAAKAKATIESEESIIELDTEAILGEFRVNAIDVNKAMEELNKLNPTTDDSLRKVNDTKIEINELDQKQKESANIEWANGIYNKFTAGDISGFDALQVINGYTKADGTYVPPIGSNTVSTADDEQASAFLSKIKDNLVPKKYKQAADDMLKYLDDSFFGYKNEKNIDQTGLAHRKLWIQGAVADLFMDSAANEMSPSEFSEAMAGYRRLFTAETLNAITSGKIQASGLWPWTPDTEKISGDMLEKNYNMGKESSVYFNDESNTIEWADPEIKKTFDAIAGQFSNLLQERNVTPSGPATPLMVGDEMYPVPVFTATFNGGKETYLYTIDRGEIFASRDSGKTWQRQLEVNSNRDFANKAFTERSAVNQYFDQFR